MAQKKVKRQPTKYDHVALEAEFMAGDSDNVRKFFQDRKIPLKTGYRMSREWPQKWAQIKQQGLKIFKNRLAKEVAAQAEAELVMSKAYLKVAADGLFPSKEDQDKKGLKPLLPKTAREAAMIGFMGNQMRKRVLDEMNQAVQVEVTSQQPALPPGGSAGSTPAASSPVVSISIKLPAKNPPPE
jgi:hypothetical protein